MHFLDPQRAMRAFQDGVVGQIKSFFPYKGRTHTLALDSVEVDDTLDPDDYRSQRKAKTMGRSWTVPVKASFRLLDNKSGKVLDKKTVRILNLPKITQRYSYIVEGNDYQVDNLWRLKAGVYARIKANGELESKWNLARGLGFNIGFDPERRKFNLRYGTTNIALYPILKAMGASDEALEKAWGKPILATNKAVNEERELQKFHKAAFGERPAQDDDPTNTVREVFEETKMLPEVNKITLGKPFTKVTGDALLSGATKLLDISRGKAEPDRRDALIFKELWGVEDYLKERIRNSSRAIRRKLGNNVDRKTDIREIVSSDIFNRPIKTFFTATSLSNLVPQVNPMEMISGRLKTTVLAEEGGISSPHAITQEAKMVDPSHLGFLDPVHTPESDRSGISLHLGIGVRKKGTTPYIPVIDAKTNRMVEKSPAELHNKVVALPDQVRKSGKGYVPIAAKIKVSGKDNEIEMRPFKDVDYILPSSKMLFGVTANLIPFLASDQGNRAGMATRHIEQAISLKAREQPLVQTGTEAGKTFEDIYGAYVSVRAKTGGEVLSVGKDSIKVRTKGGKTLDHQLYDNFPLNDSRTGIWSTPTVKKGDTVKKGQLLADSSYTKDGVLALGRNARVGYLSWYGLNYEDGIVVSESLAKRMTSEHLYKKGVFVDKNVVVDKKKFRAYYPERMSDKQADKLDDDGVIKIGQTLEPGDFLASVLRKEEVTGEARQLARLSKSLVKPYQDRSIMWEYPFSGTVVDIVRHGRNIKAYVRTEEPLQVGDKLSGRHGNKGVVVSILPDHEMPHDKEGESLEIILNTTGVPGRINPGQVLETALSKVAEKTGKPYVVSNFESSQARTVTVKEHWRTIQTKEGPKKVKVREHARSIDYTQKVQEELTKYGLSETEEMFNPVTGRSLGQVLVGKQYILKLHHQMTKKLTARSRGAYDINMVPKRGGTKGAQSIGELGLYSLLSMGARHNIRDMMTYKSNYNPDVWAALQTGEPLPPPTPSFAYNKFLSYLNALGVNVEKEGNSLTLIPFTEEQILEMSNGELKSPTRVLRGKDLREEAGGLFDPVITGGVGGTKWSHMTLAEPMPNPLFESAIKKILGLNASQYNALVSGEEEVEGKRGGAAIGALLGALDIDKELKEAEEQIESANGQRLDKLNKKIRYLRALKEQGLDPSVYMMNRVPIIPPTMRPITQLEDGNLNFDDLNGLYRSVALVNQQLREFPKGLPEEEKKPLRDELYDGLKSLNGLGGSLNRESKGILDLISPTKKGFFQNRVSQRRQDLTMRSIIVPEPEMDLDELGIPRKAALELYKPFIVRELVRQGYTPLESQGLMDDKHTLVDRALESVIGERPVIFKRDPALHKFNVLAFRPKLVEGLSLKIHPLVTGAYNADFDGDQMSVYVPVSTEAVREAYEMLPSRNLFNPASGAIMYIPTLDSQLGLYRASKWHPTGPAKGKFDTHTSVNKALKEGKVKMTDPITFKGTPTTPGRVMIDDALPSKMRGGSHLTDKNFLLNGKGLRALFTKVAKSHPKDFGTFANKLQRMGFAHASDGFSFRLKDFSVSKRTRDRILASADVEANKIKSGAGTKSEKDRKLVKVYSDATQQLRKAYAPILEATNNRLWEMHKAGIKPQPTQLEQILWAPMLMSDPQGRIIPEPVRRSYSEGLDIGGYWTAASGVRKGLVEKVLSVSRPGALSKQVMNSVMNQLVTGDDCETVKGISLDSSSKEILDRYLAVPVKVRGRTIPKGSLITPEVQSTFANNRVGKVLVRSPMRCESKDGLCAKCYGLSEDGRVPSLGTNLGAQAAQAVGERSVQLSMRTFHTGGTAAAGGGIVGAFDRVNQLLKIPQHLANAATLSRVSGSVEKIEKDPAGGWGVTVKGERHYVPQNLELKVKKGAKVSKGDAMSSGPTHPRELLDLTNINKTQNYLADEMFNVFKEEGLRRRNMEVIVKAITNLTSVKDSGGHPGLIRGDVAPLSKVTAWNRENPTKKVTHSPVLKGIETLPLDMQEDWLARLQYRKLKQTITDAAQEGWTSDIHGTHPIPGIAYSAEFGKPPEDKPWAY